MSNFKNFVKTEEKKKQKEKINKFFDYIADNIGDIFLGIYILSIVFSLLYVIFAKSSHTYETNIVSINEIHNVYVNKTDTTYHMNIESKKDELYLKVNLSKDEYVSYKNAYNKKITKYLYEDVSGFYFIVIIYLVVSIFVIGNRD